MRWRLLLLYMLMVGVAFYVVAASLINLVGNYMLDQRAQDERAISEHIAITMADKLNAQDGQALYDAAVDASREHGGRVLVLDAYGTVQADSYSLLNGTQLKHPEVVAVLGGKAGANGLDKEELPGGNWLLSTFGFADDASVYGLARIGHSVGRPDNGRAGVFGQRAGIVFAPFVYQAADRILAAGRGVLATLITVIFMSRIVTRPIKALSEGIEHTSAGDFSHRVIKSAAIPEYAQLAAAFNMMSEKLENLDRSRGQFVSNASHELKTPLATMKILIESLIYQDAFDPAMTREFLTDIDKEIDRLNSGIGDLANAGQYGQRRNAAAPERFDSCTKCWPRLSSG